MDCLKNIICVFVCVQTGNLYVHFHKQSIHNRIISSNLASSTTWESFFLFFFSIYLIFLSACLSFLVSHVTPNYSSSMVTSSDLLPDFPISAYSFFSYLQVCGFRLCWAYLSEQDIIIYVVKLLGLLLLIIYKYMQVLTSTTKF